VVFFVSNVTGVRSPYRVTEVQRDREAGDEQSPEHQFGDESEAEHHEKFLKASEKLYKKKSVILASQIMSEKLVSLDQDLSLEDAWEKIKGYEIEHFPIITEEGKLVGLLSERELLRQMKESEKKTLKEIVSNTTLCADPKTNIQDVIKVFFDENVEAVPIVDKHHRVVGVLSRNDLLKTMLKVSHIRP